MLFTIKSTDSNLRYYIIEFTINYIIFSVSIIYLRKMKFKNITFIFTNILAPTSFFLINAALLKIIHVLNNLRMLKNHHFAENSIDNKDSKK